MQRGAGGHTGRRSLGGCRPRFFCEAADDIPLSENNMVARADHGMIRSGTRSRRGPRMSPTPDSTLDDPQQLIAELQRQLAERNAERDEALAAGKTATAEVLQVINSSPGDLAPVFDAMLEKAHGYARRALRHLCTYDGERFHRPSRRMPRPRLDQSAESIRQAVSTGSGPNAFYRRGRRRAARPYRRLTARRRLPTRRSRRRAAPSRCGIRTFLIVPLRKDDMLLGIIIVYRREVRPFTDKQIALLQNSRRRRSSRWRTRG